MKQGKRVQKKEKTKQAILKAALELFAAKGFYATTTKAISKKAQIAEGTLFNYFETKEDLALYFFEEENRPGCSALFRPSKRCQNHPFRMIRPMGGVGSIYSYCVPIGETIVSCP